MFSTYENRRLTAIVYKHCVTNRETYDVHAQCIVIASILFNT